MLPFQDYPDDRRHRFPFVMLGLLLVNLAVFGYELSLSPIALRDFLSAYGVTPAAISGTALVAGHLPPFLTVFTAMFLHGGLLHLFGNMVFLWVFGDNVESELGRLTFLAFYFAAGAGGFLAEALARPHSVVPAIGASGAIAGILAAYMLLFPRAQVRVLLLFGPFLSMARTAALPMIGFWFVLQLFQSVGALSSTAMVGTAYFAHLGGFGLGLAGAWVLRSLRHETMRGAVPRIWWDDYLRNWLIVVGSMGVGLLLMTIARIEQVDRWRMVVLIVAVGLALIDGVLRAVGRRSLLGPGRGLSRLLAIAQIIAGLVLLAGLLLG